MIMHTEMKWVKSGHDDLLQNAFQGQKKTIKSLSHNSQCNA
jgi:hypothetical protein